MGERDERDSLGRAGLAVADQITDAASRGERVYLLIRSRRSIVGRRSLPPSILGPAAKMAPLQLIRTGNARRARTCRVAKVCDLFTRATWKSSIIFQRA